MVNATLISRRATALIFFPSGGRRRRSGRSCPAARRSNSCSRPQPGMITRPARGLDPPVPAQQGGRSHNHRAPATGSPVGSVRPPRPQRRPPSPPDPPAPARHADTTATTPPGQPLIPTGDLHPGDRGPGRDRVERHAEAPGKKIDFRYLVFYREPPRIPGTPRRARPITAGHPPARPHSTSPLTGEPGPGRNHSLPGIAGRPPRPVHQVSSCCDVQGSCVPHGSGGCRRSRPRTSTSGCPRSERHVVQNGRWRVEWAIDRAGRRDLVCFWRGCPWRATWKIAEPRQITVGMTAPSSQPDHFRWSQARLCPTQDYLPPVLILKGFGTAQARVGPGRSGAGLQSRGFWVRGDGDTATGRMVAARRRPIRRLRPPGLQRARSLGF